MIAWCVESGAAPLVKAHPAVNRLVVLPKGWLKSPAAIARARRDLQALRCDTVIDPQSLTKSAIAGWLSGARTRIGFAPPQGREAAPWLHNVRIERSATHVVDSYLELLQPLDIVKPQVRFGIRLDDETTSSVDKFLFHTSLRDGYAVINPGAGWDSKVWPNERYAAVAQHLGHYGLKTVVVWAGDRERQWAEEIVSASGGSAVLAPKTSLLELAGLAKSAKFFIGSDTGPMHLAASFDVPCIALFGTTKAEECGPYGDGHIRLQKEYQAGSCSERRGASNAAMCAIEVDDVCDACDQLLDRLHTAQPSTRRAA
jgi:ADP-heptose:LPS heptosyltransferase